MQSPTTIIITELLDKGLLFLLLGIAVYVFYKKDETRRKNDLIEREAMRLNLEAKELRIENYLNEHAKALQTLVKESTTASQNLARTTEAQTSMMSRTNETMVCIISEIKDFKKSEIYKYHEKSKQ